MSGVNRRHPIRLDQRPRAPRHRPCRLWRIRSNTARPSPLVTIASPSIMNERAGSAVIASPGRVRSRNDMRSLIETAQKRVESVWSRPRKRKLGKLLRAPHLGIVLNEHYEGDGNIIFKHACKLGCEGIVSKRLGSLYRSGRSPHWVKVKNPKAPAVKREAEEDWGR